MRATARRRQEVRGRKDKGAEGGGRAGRGWGCNKHGKWYEEKVVRSGALEVSD